MTPYYTNNLLFPLSVPMEQELLKAFEDLKSAIPGIQKPIGAHRATDHLLFIWRIGTKEHPIEFPVDIKTISLALFLDGTCYLSWNTKKSVEDPIGPRSFREPEGYGVESTSECFLFETIQDSRIKEKLTELGVVK